jgi:hypothetical protein
MIRTVISMMVEAAVARPMFERLKRWSITNLAGTSEAMPGPPCVSATTRS